MPGQELHAGGGGGAGGPRAPQQMLDASPWGAITLQCHISLRDSTVHLI